MKRTYAFFLSALVATTISAAPAIDVAALKAYATKALPRCADEAISLQRVDEPSPAGFVKFALLQTSSDPTCGKKENLLYSPTTEQVLIGNVIPLPADNRSVDLRVTQAVSERLQVPVTTTLGRGFPLPDGLKTVSMAKPTQNGPFIYHGYIDASEQYLIVASRGNLRVPPSKTLIDALDLRDAVRRGNPKAKVTIIELSDFECPTCGRAHKVVEPLIEKHLKNVDYYRLDLPLFEMHKWALNAALGARAVEKVAPKKYWEYVNYVFANQEPIEQMNFDTVLKNFSEDHDISWPAVEKIYRSPAERNALVEQVSRILDLGINSTPTYIINGQIMGYGPEGKYTIDAVKKAIGAK
jgi:protein-disulfide isomerase